MMHSDREEGGPTSPPGGTGQERLFSYTVTSIQRHLLVDMGEKKIFLT